MDRASSIPLLPYGRTDHGEDPTDGLHCGTVAAVGGVAVARRASGYSVPLVSCGVAGAEALVRKQAALVACARGHLCRSAPTAARPDHRILQEGNSMERKKGHSGLSVGDNFAN